MFSVEMYKYYNEQQYVQVCASCLYPETEPYEICRNNIKMFCKVSQGSSDNV
jgi:hypothetical protein